MTFGWAVDQLLDGKAVRRASWPRRRRLFLGFHLGQQCILVRWEGDRSAAGDSVWHIPQGAVLADDWGFA